MEYLYKLYRFDLTIQEIQQFQMIDIYKNIAVLFHYIFLKKCHLLYIKNYNNILFHLKFCKRI